MLGPSISCARIRVRCNRRANVNAGTVSLIGSVSNLVSISASSKVFSSLLRWSDFSLPRRPSSGDIGVCSKAWHLFRSSSTCSEMSRVPRRAQYPKHPSPPLWFNMSAGRPKWGLCQRHLNRCGAKQLICIHFRTISVAGSPFNVAATLILDGARRTRRG